MAKRARGRPRQPHPPEKPRQLADLRKEPTPRRWLVISSGVGALALFLVTYLLRLDQVVGQYVDDAWYAVLAKSLATGHGYTLVNAPTAGIGAIYPPGYPWLLSLAYRLWPQFPENVELLKSISIAAMLAVGVVCYTHFKRICGSPPYLAFGIALATVLNPALVFLSTSTLMSECVFTLALLLTIHIIERGLQVSKGGRGWPYIVLGGVLASFTFLTRSIALALIVGTVVYLLKERLTRGAAVFLIVVTAIVGPWTVYARMHAATPDQRAQQNCYIVMSYAEAFWHRQAGDPYSGEISINEVPRRIWNNLRALVEHDVGVTVFAPLPYWEKGGELTAEGITSSPTTPVLSVLASVLAILGFLTAVRARITLIEIVFPLSLAIIVAWPWGPFRFVLPFLPFMLFYISMGVRSLHQSYRRWQRVASSQTSWVASGIVVWCLVALSIHANAGYILRKYSSVQVARPEWIRLFEEHETLFEWIRNNISEETTLIAQNPPLLHLYTGQKTVPAAGAALRRDVWEKLGVRYLVQMGVPRPPDPNAAELRFKTLYRSETDLNLRVVDLRQQSPTPP